MLDDNGVLSDLLRALRQKAAQDFICLLESIADELEVESEPFEEYGQEDEPEGFYAVWMDR